MGAHNICLRGEMGKMLCGYPILSEAIATVRRNQCYLQAATLRFNSFRREYINTFLVCEL